MPYCICTGTQNIPAELNKHLFFWSQSQIQYTNYISFVYSSVLFGMKWVETYKTFYTVISRCAQTNVPVGSCNSEFIRISQITSQAIYVCITAQRILEKWTHYLGKCPNCQGYDYTRSLIHADHIDIFFHILNAHITDTPFFIPVIVP